MYYCLLLQRYSHRPIEMGESSPGPVRYPDSYDYAYRNGIEVMEVDKPE